MPKKKASTPISFNTTQLIGIGAVIVLVLTLIVISFIINSSVRRNCLTAQIKHGGTCVSALVNILKDKDTYSFRERNTAIWTLGRLRDPEALSTLYSFYTGIIPEREPYDDGISQYELQKAIKFIEK